MDKPNALSAHLSKNSLAEEGELSFREGHSSGHSSITSSGLSRLHSVIESKEGVFLKKLSQHKPVLTSKSHVGALSLTRIETPSGLRRFSDYLSNNERGLQPTLDFSTDDGHLRVTLVEDVNARAEVDQCFWMRFPIGVNVVDMVLTDDELLVIGDNGRIYSMSWCSEDAKRSVFWDNKISSQISMLIKQHKEYTENIVSCSVKNNGIKVYDSAGNYFEVPLNKQIFENIVPEGVVIRDMNIFESEIYFSCDNYQYYRYPMPGHTFLASEVQPTLVYPDLGGAIKAKRFVSDGHDGFSIMMEDNEGGAYVLT